MIITRMNILRCHTISTYIKEYGSSLKAKE